MQLFASPQDRWSQAGKIPSNLGDRLRKASGDILYPDATPEKVQVRTADVTLREGAQGPFSGLTAKNKLLIAIALGEIRVNMLEIGHASSPLDTRENLADIVREVGVVGGPALRMLSRGMKGDIEWSDDVLKNAHDREIHIYIPTDKNIAHRMGGKNESEQQARTIQKIHEMISYAQGIGFARIEFSPEGGLTTEDFSFLCKSCITALEAGATILNIPDTLGRVKSPATYERFRLLRQVLGPYLKKYDAILSCHQHDDDGEAVANARAALRGGAVMDHTMEGFHFQVESCLLGGGERNGITSTESVLMHLHDEGYQTNTKVGPLLYHTAHAMRHMTGHDHGVDYPIIGRTIYANAAGVHHAGQNQADKSSSGGGYLNSDRMTLFGIRPEEILFYQSGTTLIASMLERFGIVVDRTSDIGKKELDSFMQHINHHLLDAQGWHDINVVSAWNEWKGMLSWNTESEDRIGFTLGGITYFINTRPKNPKEMSEIGGTIEGINGFFRERGMHFSVSGDKHSVSDDVRYQAHDKETTQKAAEDIAAYSPKIADGVERGIFAGDIEGLGFCEVELKVHNTRDNTTHTVRSRGAGTNMREVVIKALIEAAILPVLMKNI